mmetsp:Transcript_18478/g.25901  ORF Transcript_18478/g.25901 Transcript_18478/m.25901 type:complete len:550 (+) Transcript_18478:63-1712(+)
MVYTFRCLCFNITVHLTEKPTSTEAPQSTRNSPAIVISNKKQPALSPRGKQKKFDDQLLEALLKQIKWKSYSIGDLALAGVQISQPRLSQTFDITQNTNNPKDSTPKRKNSVDSVGWRTCKCLNCNTEIYAIHESQPNTVVLNAQIEQKSVEERLKEMPGYIYSNGYKILLQSNTEALNNVLECPDESDKGPFEAFTNLQNQLDQALKEEHLLMEERIEAFKQEQLQLYNQFQTNTYSERKILWYKICKTLDWDVLMNDTAQQSSAVKIPDSTETEKSKSSHTFKNLVIFEDYKKDNQSPAQTPPNMSVTPSSVMTQSPNPNSIPNSQPKAGIALSKELEDKLDRATVLFDFEEDMSDAETKRQYKSKRTKSKAKPGINIVSIDVAKSPQASDAQQPSPNNNTPVKEIPVEEPQAEESAEEAEDESDSEDEQPAATGTRTEQHRQKSRRRLDFEEDDEEVDVEFDDGPKKVMESINMLGTSLPMAIPSKLLAPPSESPSKRFNKEKDKEVIASRQFKVRSDDVELSKSFDVPVSQNRRLTEHIISLQNY